MKKLFKLIADAPKKVCTVLCGVMIAAAAFKAFAVSPSYVRKSGFGNGTAGASVIFPSAEGLQLRICNVNYHSDSNTAVLNFSTGSNVVSVTLTNLSTTYATQYVNSTVGLVTNTMAILEHAGVGYLARLVATNGATNAVFDTGAFGVQSSVGDNIYFLGASNSIPIGASTNAINGEAIYVADSPGRPVFVQLTPALTTNRLNTVVARQE